MGSEKMLADILEPLRGLYDYIIVDTCPSLGTLTINALTAADEVIIAVNPQVVVKQFWMRWEFYGVRQMMFRSLLIKH